MTEFLFEHVPNASFFGLSDVIWSGIISASMALTVAGLTLGISIYLQKNSLKHSEIENEKKRKSESRHSNCENLIVSVIEFFVFIQALPLIISGESNKDMLMFISEYQKINKAFEIVRLTAESETIRIINSALILYDNLSIKIPNAMKNLIISKKKMQINLGYLGTVNSENDSELYTQNVLLAKEYEKETINFSKFILTECKEFSALNTKIFSNLKQELGFDCDIDEEIDALKKRLNNLYSSLEIKEIENYKI
ncbi:hypothetical protein [Piscirickettsia salmonis]|uniref:hypothetical protein n=1 Tax=Piscirickettsia salmonis TaxID=1238 RepID=UPI003EBA7015